MDQTTCSLDMVHKTGVDWCELTVSGELSELVHVVRSNEKRVKAMGEPVLDQLVREVTTDGVSAAHLMALDAQLDTDELFERCFALRGRPFDEARSRRDMRERIRVYRHIKRAGSDAPRTLDDMLGLWSEALCGEMPVYAESEVAQFRTRRIPFGHRGNPFEPAKPAAGRETVEAARIPYETEALLAFMSQSDLPCEIVAAASHFLCGHIHPFSDGNGHVARMLACAQLADSYSMATILSLLRRLQMDRGTMNLAMSQTVEHKDDLENVIRVFLKMIDAAQHDLLPVREGFVRLPLRIVRTEGLELMAAHRKGREVYRMDDGRIMKVVANRERLTRACAIFEANAAAHKAGAALARPYEIVHTLHGYAMVLEYVDGPSVGDLVIQGVLSPKEAGETMARTLRELHAHKGEHVHMRDVRRPFLTMVDTVAPWLSSSTAEVCRRVVLGMAPATTLVHGDVHMGNVIVSADGSIALIDADTISMGQPVFDLACTCSSLLCEGVVDPKRAEVFHGVPVPVSKAIWESLVSAYYADGDEAQTEEQHDQMELLAWLVLLNRLTTVGRDSAPFGEITLQILQATGCLAKAANRLKS